jgi:hypothetical protein
MTRALVGYTGFVGATLLADGGYTHGFNSRDIEEMRGGRFDEVVCAGVPAVKWLANREPEGDRAAIGRLLAVLETVRTGRFVLISTVDVYADPSLPQDETADPAGLGAGEPYGRHRLEVERFVAARFPTHAIVRLPALFGDGLKKNALFDLLHEHQTEKLNPAARFQWYPTRRLAGDLRRIAGAGLSLVNLVSEPIALAEVIQRFFPTARVGLPVDPAPHYNLRTRHAALFGGEPPFISRRAQVLAAMADFIKSARREPPR